jgi:hypothetical protein
MDSFATDDRGVDRDLYLNLSFLLIFLKSLLMNVLEYY